MPSIYAHCMPTLLKAYMAIELHAGRLVAGMQLDLVIWKRRGSFLSILRCRFYHDAVNAQIPLLACHKQADGLPYAVPALKACLQPAILCG